MDELLNNAPCGFLSFADDGTILTANRTLTGWPGRDEDELTGRHVETLLPPGGRDAARQAAALRSRTTSRTTTSRATQVRSPSANRGAVNAPGM